MSRETDDSLNVVIKDVSAFMTQSERTVGSFVRNKHIVAGFKAMKRYSKNDVFRANCFNSAIEHVLFKKRAMTAEEQSVLVIRFLIDKNTKENWIGEVGTNVKGQDGYDTIQKTVKEMKDITVRYSLIRCPITLLFCTVQKLSRETNFNLAHHGDDVFLDTIFAYK